MVIPTQKSISGFLWNKTSDKDCTNDKMILSSLAALCQRNGSMPAERFNGRVTVQCLGNGSMAG
jgi:hypothetical protein